MVSMEEIERKKMQIYIYDIRSCNHDLGIFQLEYVRHCRLGRVRDRYSIAFSSPNPFSAHLAHDSVIMQWSSCA